MSRIINLTYPLDLKTKIIDLVRAGEISPNAVLTRLVNPNYKLPANFYNDKELNLEMLNAYVLDVLKNYGNYETVKRIYNYTIVAPKNSTEWFIYDKNKDVILERTTEKAIRLAVNGEGPVNDKLTGYSAGYNPHCRSRFYSENGVDYFNMYQPPAWKYDYWQGKEIPVVSKIPDVYAEFLNHFVDGRITDIEYILDWLSTSIRNKNQTFLIASGASGAGKGTFSKILKMLHGVDTNSVEIAGASLKSQFNKNLWGKTLVYVNEFQFIAGETAQKIKTFIDDDINIELKGVDSFKSTNYASYYFTTNKLEIELDDSDRRYSFIDLTTKTWDFAKTGPLLAPENIKQLAYFLWHRNVDESKNAKPHSSATRDFAKRVQYTDWQVYLIEEFFTQYAGKVISISNLLSFLKSKAFKLNTKQLKTWIRETHSKAKIITASPSIATIFLDENSLAITTDSSKQTSKALETDLCQIL
jgi:hypothetical protein